MPKSRKKERPPKHVFALPGLEQSKTAVLNSLTSKSGQRSYDRAITDFRGLVLLGAAPRIHSHGRLAIPNPSRTEAVCADHDQPAPGCRPARRV
jgi:hypothetical protein